MAFAYMEGRAFRHGDIEDELAELIKRGSSFALASMIGGGHKFNGLDIKRVYFGNWLRDYSQALDIASLKKMPQQAHGYATHEFEVTPERIGVYLPVEHIDNPKGYGEGEDPRKYHPGLRPPVDPRELEIDPRTGMKNYIANEQGSWDTSKALVRRLLERCIHLGRQHRDQGRKEDEYEAYRLLGTLLHTLEDFTAHSNWCELALVMMGHRDVFLHVGDQVRVQAPGGQWVAPIVTGTFGSNDFAHSMLGEATDHLSQASVTDLNKSIDKARSASNTSRGRSEGDVLRDLLFSIPGGEGGEMSREMDAVERIRAGPQGGGKKPEDMTPQELHAVLWQVLEFRDSVVKKISKTIEKIPGLGALIDKITDSISVFVFTTLEPFLKPILKTTTANLSEISGEVINSQDQYEVFNDPRASDPTHSFLSKDHFVSLIRRIVIEAITKFAPVQNLILNEPAGHIAKVVVRNTVGLVIKAWDDRGVNVRTLSEEVLECLFHPNFHRSSSKVQREMLQEMTNWVNGLGKRKEKILHRLTKAAVRAHENIRLAGEGGAAASQGSYAEAQGLEAQHALLGYANQIPGVAQAAQLLDAAGGGKKKKHGKGREGGGYDGSDDGGAESGAYAPSHVPAAGQAASYYSDAPGHEAPHYAPPSGPPPSAGYAPPSGPPPGSYASPPGPPPGSYAPPSGPPPGSYAPSYDMPSASQHAGYAPSYAPSFPSGSARSVPGGAPSFPEGTPHAQPPRSPGRSPPPQFSDASLFPQAKGW
ncbi:hypothetical protein DXG01_014811 [Tephrocybe rancida]|nr:hypothetical protein DXG01_014811 [Tephrocybe rancida]